jgi:hypothetical protein
VKPTLIPFVILKKVDKLEQVRSEAVFEPGGFIPYFGPVPEVEFRLC